MSSLPVLCFPDRKFGDNVFRFLAWTSMTLTALAFLFMIGIAAVAKYRFEQNGFTASFGNLVRLNRFGLFLKLIKPCSISMHCRWHLSYCFLQPLSAHTFFRRFQRQKDLVAAGISEILRPNRPRDVERSRESL